MKYEVSFITSLVLILGLSVAGFRAVSAQVMSSGSYSVQNDSINVSGGDSSSSSYNLESTTGEVATGNSDSASYAVNGGYQQQFVDDSTNPSVPTGLTATAVSSSRIDLSWTASTDNIGVSGYRILRDSTIIATTTATSYQNTGLSAVTTYTYEVEAFDSSLNYSGLSASASATTEAEPVGSGNSGSRPQQLASIWQILGMVSTTTPVTGPANVSVFSATPRTSDILLGWSITPGNTAGETVAIVRSLEFYPASVTEGTLVFEGVGNIFVDRAVTEDVVYYYTLFVKDTQGAYSSGAAASAVIRPRPVVVPTPVVTPPVPEPLETLPEAPEPDPQITSLTLADFDFIQDGRVIAQTDELIAIDGSKNLSVRLDYDRVPEILKTIAVTLKDPDDTAASFTFLLKVNADKTAYEATVAPLARTGTYDMSIAVVDHENQAQKRIEGELKALGLGDAETVTYQPDKINTTRIAIIAVTVLVVLFVLLKLLRIYV